MIDTLLRIGTVCRQVYRLDKICCRISTPTRWLHPCNRRKPTSPGQGSAERQHRCDLTSLRDDIGLGAEDIDGQVDGYASDEQLGDQIAVPQEAPRRQPCSPSRQRYAGQVQDRGDGTGRRAEPEEIGAA